VPALRRRYLAKTEGHPTVGRFLHRVQEQIDRSDAKLDETTLSRLTEPDRSTVQTAAGPKPAAFVNPAVGTLGTLSLYSLKGPGIFQFDMALSRTFAIREKKTLQIRFEALNLPNHVNPAIPGTTAGVGPRRVALT
jgi:hypothetical protein